MEIFDSGNLWFAKQLCAEGLVDDPPLFQLCLGIPWGAPCNTQTMAYQVGELPKNAIWAGFGIGRSSFPWWRRPSSSAAMSASASRTISGSKRASMPRTAPLVERAAKIIELLGTKIASPDEAREILKLKQRVTAMGDIATVGIAGTGLIGAGWAARLLVRGVDVIAYDRGRRRGKAQGGDRRRLAGDAQLIGRKTARRGKLSFTTDLAKWRRPISSRRPPPSAKT